MEDSLFNKYKIELDKDVIVDDFNVKDSQLKLPGVKHKWVARLIQHKIEKSKLKNLKAEAITSLIAKYRNESVVDLSDKTLREKALQSDVLIRIDAKIEENDAIIEYLEKVEKILSSITFDIKNIIEIRKLEMT